MPCYLALGSASGVTMQQALTIRDLSADGVRYSSPDTTLQLSFRKLCMN
jgi:hypothetical protein